MVNDLPDSELEQAELMPEPEENLEVVFETGDDSEALVVKGLLESNGIEVAMSTPEAPIGVFPVTASDLGAVKLLVREEQAEDARRLIAESEATGPADAERAELDDETGGPPAA